VSLRTMWLMFVLLWAGQFPLRAQDFKIFDRQVQVHGWISQGFSYTNENNWLTMNTLGIPMVHPWQLLIALNFMFFGHQSRPD
jgi:hypothetical protein